MRSMFWRFVAIMLFLIMPGCTPVGDDSAVPEIIDPSEIVVNGEANDLGIVASEQIKISPSENQTDYDYDDGDDQFIDPIDVQQIVIDAYPDLNFGEDIMFGPEEVDGTWISAYMMSATITPDIFEVIVDARTGEIVKEVTLEGYAAMASACYVYPVALGGWYSQRDPSWSSIFLGNSTVWTIGSDGCYLTSLAMIYHNVWGVSTTPAELNTSAKSARCFAAGSADINASCAVNSRGGPHSYSSISMSSVATAICAGYPVVIYVTWGGGHKMLVYYYSGGSTSSMSSYRVVDPWTGTSKSLSGYTATRWLKFY